MMRTAATSDSGSTVQLGMENKKLKLSLGSEGEEEEEEEDDSSSQHSTPAKTIADYCYCCDVECDKSTMG